MRAISLALNQYNVMQPFILPSSFGRQLLRLSDLTTQELDALTHPEVPRGAAAATIRGTMALLFEQPSLRTASTFAAAAVQAGLVPIPINARGHALRADCDLADELFQLSKTADCVAVRVAQALEPDKLVNCQGLLINAGDGDNEHPTQALTDLTVLRQIGVANKSVALLGNLRDHRTHHSLLAGLKAFGAQVTLVAPPGMAMAPKHSMGCSTLETTTVDEVDEVLSNVDAVYLTPVAYWGNPHEHTPGAYRLDLARALRVLKPDAKVLHPFPRHGELDTSLDATHFDAYGLQLAIATAVRARLLKMLMPS